MLSPKNNMTKDMTQQISYGCEPNTRLFDQAAVGFGCAIDRSLQQRRYLRGELFVNAIVDRVEAGGLVLDYGCGPGRISLMLACKGFRLLGLDPSSEMIATASRQTLAMPNLKFQVCSTCLSEPPEIQYAAIVCSSVIEYVANPEALLRWFSGALRPYGPLVISFANSRSLWGAWARWRYKSGFRIAQRHLWSWPQFRRLLNRCGFAPETEPVYFESPLDRVSHLRSVAVSSFAGTLGFIVARACR
jgi:SAM-dependent methyltransferase